MMKISENLLRYLMVHTRRTSRLAFSSRDALSLILIAGLPFVMVSSISINKSLHQNMAYAYGGSSAVQVSADASRVVAAQVKGNPEALLKITGVQAGMIFDEPGLKRTEGDMAIWQYRTNDCVLDLYIADTGEGAVTHYEARPRLKASTARSAQAFDAAQSRECVKSVFAGHDGVVPLQFASR